MCQCEESVWKHCHPLFDLYTTQSYRKFELFAQLRTLFPLLILFYWLFRNSERFWSTLNLERRIFEKNWGETVVLFSLLYTPVKHIMTRAQFITSVWRSSIVCALTLKITLKLPGSRKAIETKPRLSARWIILLAFCAINDAELDQLPFYVYHIRVGST